MQLNRRDFLRLGLVLPPALLIACSGDDEAATPAATATGAPTDAPSDGGAGDGSQAASSQQLTPTPSCGDEPTPRQTEGPFFTPDTPERTSLLEPRLSGTTFVVEGYVLTQSVPAAGRHAARLLAGGHERRVRQRRLPAARPPVQRRRRPLPPRNDHAGPVPDPDAAHPRQGAGAEPARPDDAALLPRPSAQRRGLHLPARARHGAERRRRRPNGALRLRPRPRLGRARREDGVRRVEVDLGHRPDAEPLHCG